MGMRIGCCGFPVGQTRYARTFPVVEVQQSFYQIPPLTTLARWRQRLPPPFEFTLKAWQLITHEASSPTYRRLGEKLSPAQLRRCGSFQPTAEVFDAWDRTAAAAQTLEAHVVLFQCPARFTPTPQHIRNLTEFFQRIERGHLLFVWEPRGAWDPTLVRRLCRQLDLVHGVDPFTQLPVAGPFRYFRLHGRTGYRYRYTSEDLRELANLCRKRQRTYVLFNNAWMWDDARRFARLCQQDAQRS